MIVDTGHIGQYSAMPEHKQGTPMYVYFLEADGCFPATVKIGISSDVRGRITCLQTAMPFELKLLGWVAYPSTSMARDAERKLHKKLRLKRLQGEWFRLTPKTRDFIVALVGDSKGIPPAMTERPKNDGPNYDPPPAAPRDRGKFRSGLDAVVLTAT